MKTKFGFTLAEVLITLGIIGVVAAITIPNLIANYQKRSAITNLKHIHAQLTQAIKLSEYENGPVESWDIYRPGDFNASNTYAAYSKAVLEYIQPYLKVSRIGYVYDGKELYTIHNMKGEKFGAVISRHYLETMTGAIISVNHVNWYNPYIFFQVDYNGKSGPNIYGKDVFFFHLAKSGNLDAYNWANKSREEILKSNCCKTCTDPNRECLAVIMKDNWEIRKDYPW